MILRDWRGADTAIMSECYDRERRHWQDALGWDTAWTWKTVEQARLACALPGVLALNRFDRVEGWAFYMMEDAILHIGGLVADDATATAALLDIVLRDAKAAAMKAEACFILDRANGLESILAARGFDVERFHYLSLDLGSESGSELGSELGSESGSESGSELGSESGSESESGPAGNPDHWRDGDATAAAALLGASYTPSDGIHFAPTGDWNRYVSGLVNQCGCGMFDTRVSRVVRGPRRLDAVVMATMLSAETAHIAQVAVHPASRRRGLASTLVRDVATAAARSGKRRLTLLVGDRNQPARRLYAAMGFQPRATFVAARREMTRARRVSSIA